MVMEEPLLYCPKCKVELSRETDTIITCDKCGYQGYIQDLKIVPEKQRIWDGIEWK